MSDEKTIECARQWIDQLDSGLGVNGVWRLQRLDKRVRVKPGDEESSPVTVDELPTRIRRFAKGMPWALVIEAARYLHSKAPYTGVIFNGVRCDKAYYPLRTWWERDEGSVIDRGQQNEGTYTLYQDLIDRDTIDSLDFDAGGSCSEKVTMSYIYDAADIPDVDPGGIGETVSVQAVSRNEDGSLQYAVVRRKALTQTMPPVVTKDDEFERVTARTWDNVYPGEEGGYADQDGNILDIPSPSDTDDGVHIELSVQENQDCTLKISAQVTESKKLKSERTTTATIFERSSKDVVRADAPAGDDVVKAGGGRVKSHRWEKRSDGKFDLTDESRIEQSVDDAVWEKRKTLRSVKVSHTDRNQDSGAVAAAKAFVNAAGPGTSVRIAKTDGGRYDITYENNDSSSDVGVVAEECKKTIFVHSHTVTENTHESGFESVSEAGDGLVHTRSVRRTDEGTFDVTDAFDSEQSVDDAIVERRKSLRSVRVSRTDRNQTESAAEAARREPLKVGTSIRIAKTDGGRYDITHEQVDSSSDVGKVSEECRKTIFVHSHTVTENVHDSRVAEASEAGDGKTHTRSVKKTDEGTFDVTDAYESEQSVDEAVVERRRSVRSSRKSRTDRNQTESVAEAAKSAALKVGESVRIEKTDGGRFNITHEEPDSSAFEGSLREECRRTVFVHRHSKTVQQAEFSGSEVTAGGGVVRSKSGQLNEDNRWEVTEESETELPYSKSHRSTNSDPFKCVVVYRDTTAIDASDANESFVPFFPEYNPDQHSPNKDGANGVRTQEEYEVSNGGKATRTRTYVYAKARSWSTPAITTNYLYKRTWYFRNFTKVQLDTLLKGGDGHGGVCGYFDNKVCGWMNANRPPSSHDIDTNVSLNELGYFDGSVTVNARWASGSAGQTGDVNCIISSIEWKYYTFDPDRDRNYDSNYDGASWWNGSWHAAQYTVARVIGRGKELLDKFAGYSSIARPPSVSYNPDTGLWSMEVCVYVRPIDRIAQTGFEHASWRARINNASHQDAPANPGTSDEPSTSGTDYAGGA